MHRLQNSRRDSRKAARLALSSNFTITEQPYRGRFAPTPSGPLHLGSLFTAVASYLEARKNQGKWYVRIDDIDHFRVVDGAINAILESLEKFSLEWDDVVLYQSQHLNRYQSSLERLQELNQLYRCSCSRKQLLKLSGGKPAPYPGFCTTTRVQQTTPHSVRVKTEGQTIHFVDRLQGPVTQDIPTEVGDFVLKRRDQVFAYHLATILDDEYQGITDVLRGIDLLDSTPRQIMLQNLLGLQPTVFAHIPVLTDSYGIKLSKQTFATPIDTKQPEKTLFLCLQLLKQKPPRELAEASCREMLEWGTQNWNLNALKYLSKFPIK